NTMPSPFPGMNPYLEHEDAWHNFHEQFPDAAVAELEPQLGPNYFAKVDEHVYIHEMPEDQRRLWGRADASVGLTSREEVPRGGRGWRADGPAPGAVAGGGPGGTVLRGGPRPAQPAPGHGDRAAEPFQQAAGGGPRPV